MKAKCDWLSLSYSPDDSPLDQVKAELLLMGATLTDYSEGRKYTLAIPNFGMVAVELRRGLHYVSLSGSSLEFLRVTSRYDSMLSLLASCPHKVTRLDAAYDVHTDAADVLDALQARYVDGKAALTRKAMKITQQMGIRPDGRRSGTLYFGHRSKARVTARVYDKCLEALEKRNELLPPTVRYEVTIKDGQATLNDAYDPTAVFWHFASDVLLAPPDPAPPAWVSGGDMIGWTYIKPEVLPLDTLNRYIDKTMPTLTELADGVGEFGRETALYALARRLGLSMPQPPQRIASTSLGSSAEPAESAEPA